MPEIKRQNLKEVAMCIGRILKKSNPSHKTQTPSPDGSGILLCRGSAQKIERTAGNSF